MQKHTAHIVAMTFMRMVVVYMRVVMQICLVLRMFVRREMFVVAESIAGGDR